MFLGACFDYLPISVHRGIIERSDVVFDAETAAHERAVDALQRYRYPKDGETLRDVLDVADQAMYFCKTSGLMPLV